MKIALRSSVAISGEETCWWFLYCITVSWKKTNSPEALELLIVTVFHNWYSTRLIQQGKHFVLSNVNFHAFILHNISAQINGAQTYSLSIFIINLFTWTQVHINLAHLVFDKLCYSIRRRSSVLEDVVNLACSLRYVGSNRFNISITYQVSCHH